jgi:hypothetical protein
MIIYSRLMMMFFMMMMMMMIQRECRVLCLKKCHFARLYSYQALLPSLVYLVHVYPAQVNFGEEPFAFLPLVNNI